MNFNHRFASKRGDTDRHGLVNSKSEALNSKQISNSNNLNSKRFSISGLKIRILNQGGVMLKKSAIFFVLLANCFIVQRVAVKNCQFSLDGVDLIQLGLTDLTLGLKIGVKNPNSIDVVIDRLAYQFFVNDRSVFTGSTGEGNTIAAGGSKVITTQVRLNYLDIGSAFVTAIKERKAHYKLTGTVYFDTALGTFSFPVTILKG